jgi:hypothetical protein
LPAEIAEKIVDKKADYLLAVKENQATCWQGSRTSFQMLAADAVAEEIDCGYGRVEHHHCAAISVTARECLGMGVIAEVGTYPVRAASQSRGRPKPATTSSYDRPLILHRLIRPSESVRRRNPPHTREVVLLRSKKINLRVNQERNWRTGV